MKFKLVLSIIFLLGIIFFISACNSVQTVCGDNKCDATESCQCVDCKTDAKCTVNTIGNCDDSNSCTEDIFNEKTSQCEHNKKVICCGNGICEDGERCDDIIHQTGCPKDCTYLCDAFVNVNSFECGTAKCEKNAENTFTISGTTAIQASIENVGEKGTGEITAMFKCGKGSNLITRDGDSLYGIAFRNSFTNGANSISLSGRQSETGANKATYNLGVEISKTDTSNMECEISLQAQNGLNYINTLKLIFK